jgi:molybdate transport repressor ModE-like protein
MDDEPAIDIDTLTRAIDVHSLRILVAIDQHGTISAAARSLGYSQPTITQHVQRLEARLGTPLVARTARAAKLTQIGALLAQHAPRIDASLTAAATELARALGRRSGVVRFAAPAGAIPHIVAPAMALLAEELPGLITTVDEAADTAEAIEMVRGGRADIAITTVVAATGDRRITTHRSGLRTTFLFAEEIVALTSATADAPGARVAARTLAKLPWVRGIGTCSDVVASATGRLAHRNDLVVSRPDAAVALAIHSRGTAFVAESDLVGVTLPTGLHALGISPAFTRRTAATTLVEAASIPAVAAALRILAAPRPIPADIDAIADARRRSANHRSRFLTAAPTTEESSSMNLSATRLAQAGAVATAGALLLAACASPASESRTSPDDITVAMPGSLSSLYVGQESGILNYYIAAIAQEGLVSVDAQGAIQPGLAETWSQPDDVTYVYEIRDDAFFQDGTPVTADDIVFSLEQARDETSSPGLSWYLGNVDVIEKTGEREVTVTLLEPDAAFASNMSTGGAAFITSQAFWEANDGNVGTPDALLLGTGPYKVTEFSPDSHVSFERVDTWWGELPSVKNITINFVPDESTRLIAAQSGDIDVAFNVPLAQAEQWESLDTMRVDYVNDLSYVGLYFNTTVAPFDDPKVREAFAHAVDRTAIVDRLLRGHGEAATAIMTPESLGSVYSAEEARTQLSAIPQWAFDVDAAKAALAASSVPEGFETELLTPNTGPQLGTAAQALAQTLSEVGITLTVREVPIEEWLASLDASSDYGVNLMWYFSTLGDPAEVSSYLLGAGNPAAYDNAEVNDLLSQAGAESDQAARIAILVKAETIQAEEAINVPLWWGQSATAFANDLEMSDYSSYAFISSWPTQLTRVGQ